MNTIIKPILKCHELYKTKFKDSRCLLTISVGQEVHEGEKFATTINLINQSFKECVILVDDTLQRHTMKINSHLTIEELYEKSLKEGDEWLKRNQFIYSNLQIPYKIIRWDKWLQHEKYATQYTVIKKLYNTNSAYHSTFTITIENYLARYTRRSSVTNCNKEEQYNNCLNYLLEECTAFCLWTEENVNFEVYPSERNPAVTATYNVFIAKKYPDLLIPVSIKFKNRKKLAPQCFLT